MVETDVVEGPVEKVVRDEIVEAMQRMKSGNATGTSEVSMEMIVASGEIGVQVMMELCQHVLDGGGMPDEWITSVIVQGKGDVMSCGSYRGVKLLEHAMKIVEKVLERRTRTLINLNEMKFAFMPGKGTLDAICFVRRMQEEYQKKDKKLYMCFVDMEKVFDRVLRKVMEWAMRKKGLLEAMVQAVMSLYDGVKTRVRVGSAYSEEFEKLVYIKDLCCCCCWLPDPFRGMGAWRMTMEPQKPGNSPRSGPEVIERQRVAKEWAAQRVRSWTVQNEMRCPGTGVHRRCKKDSRFCQS